MKGIHGCIYQAYSFTNIVISNLSKDHDFTIQNKCTVITIYRREASKTWLAFTQNRR